MDRLYKTIYVADIKPKMGVINIGTVSSVDVYQNGVTVKFSLNGNDQEIFYPRFATVLVFNNDEHA